MKPFMTLSNKRYLVTGATSGIGKHICLQIDSYGGNITAIGRDEKKLLQLKNELTNFSSYEKIVFDLEKIEDYSYLYENLNQKYDGIIHSAGIVKLMPIKFFKQIDQDQIRKVNLDSIVNITSFLIKNKRINNNASLVFISSIAGHFGMKGNYMYSMTKSSLEIFAKVLAAEVSNLKIRVNTISPGQVETPLTEMIESSLSKEAIDLDKKKYPLGYGSSKNIGDLAIFLLSEKSEWINGTNIIIDGGRTSIL